MTPHRRHARRCLAISAAILVILAGLPAPLVMPFFHAAASPAPPSTGALPLTPVTVGYAAISASQAGAWVAKEEGLFAKNGLDVTLTSIPGGSSPTAALLSGKIQALQISVEAIEAGLGGADIVYVAAPLSVPIFSFVTLPSITDPQQLRGQKVAMTGFGTATYYAAVIALRHFGLDPFKDVVLVRTGSLPAMVVALNSGQVQGAALSMPTLAQATAAGMRVLVNVADLGSKYPSSWLAVRRKTIETRRADVLALVRSITEAIAFEIKDPAETQRIIGIYTKTTDPALLKETYDTLVPYLNKVPTPKAEQVGTALELIALDNPKAKGADPTKFVDPSFVQELEKAGFIDSLYR